MVATRIAQAATTATSTPLVDGGFESGVPQTAWTENQSSGGELIDTQYPHSGTWAADLCYIDNCSDSLVQGFVSPGQVTSAQLTYFYTVATSEPDNNASCKDWLSVGLGVGTTPDAGASKRYCTPTGYTSDTIDVTSFLNTHGGQTVDAQLEGFTNGLYPSQFFVDDVSLTITYKLTPSAPVVAPVTDCGAGQTTLTWTAPQFPLGTAWPVQSYLVTPYSVHGVAQPSTTVSGTTTSLPVSLVNGTVCYFTVTATNANGTGPVGSPAVPVAAVTPLATPSTTGFTLNWSLQPGSAAPNWYTVFIRDGSGPWLKWCDTYATTSTVFGTPGHTYEYYVEAFNTFGGIAPSGSGQATVTVPTSAAPAMKLHGLYGVDGFGGLHPADSPPVVATSGWAWPIARGIAADRSGTSGYVLDGWGGLHQFGTAPAVTSGGYWPGSDATRGVALRPDGVSGYVVDAFGGIWPFGGAPALPISAYWSGWDIARAIVLEPSGLGGYVLDGWGGLHQFGNAPAPATTAPWKGWDIARGVALNATGTGGYVLDGWGGVHPFGTAPAVVTPVYWKGWDIARGIVLTPSGDGGYVLDGFGGFQPFGSVTNPAITPNYAGTDTMRGVSGA
ncbi:MAG TPA: hypothetical protein VH498_00230 [Candidatus Dormibacteraeota bacterium]|nr:hypothetical protein [Candidatus Dormibacteraeota bacterium]